jgi:hypothetical protein
MSWKGFDSNWLQQHENRSRPARPPHTPTPERPQALAGSGEGEARGSGCPVVRFTLRRVQLLDVDAKYASVKDLLDGLRFSGLIRGDKEGEVDLQVHQEKVPHYAEESTTIEIDYGNP